MQHHLLQQNILDNFPSTRQSKNKMCLSFGSEAFDRKCGTKIRMSNSCTSMHGGKSNWWTGANAKLEFSNFRWTQNQPLQCPRLQIVLMQTQEFSFVREYSFISIFCGTKCMCSGTGIGSMPQVAACRATQIITVSSTAELLITSRCKCNSAAWNSNETLPTRMTKAMQI